MCEFNTFAFFAFNAKLLRGLYILTAVIFYIYKDFIRLIVINDKRGRYVQQTYIT